MSFKLRGGHHIVFNIWCFSHAYWDYTFISYPNCPSEIWTHFFNVEKNYTFCIFCSETCQKININFWEWPLVWWLTRRPELCDFFCNSWLSVRFRSNCIFPRGKKWAKTWYCEMSITLITPLLGMKECWYELKNLKLEWYCTAYTLSIIKLAFLLVVGQVLSHLMISSCDNKCSFLKGCD